MARSSQLCQRCSLLHLESETFQGQNFTALSLGRVQDWDTGCSTCQLLARLAGLDLTEAQEYTDEYDSEALGPSTFTSGDLELEGIYDVPFADQEYSLVPFNTATVFADPPAVTFVDRRSPVSYTAIESQNAHNDGRVEVFNCVRSRGWLSRCPIVEESLPFTPTPMSKVVNIELIKSWLRRCTSEHSHCNSPMLRTMSSIKLVDCSARRVVGAGPELPYLTLSYVCAEVAEPIISDQRLLVTQPQLIEDAISLTLQLGYQWLWIDRYCINQEDLVEKAAQIQQMDQIYSRSALTIIAAATCDGLSGIRARAGREPTMLCGEAYQAMPPTPRCEIEQSRWNERAWTYQESVLSRRRLVFLSHQVYFECLGMRCCDTLHGALHEYSTTPKLAPSASHLWWESEAFINLTVQRDPLTHIYSHLAEYTKRELSFSTDVLNAIEGVLAQMRQLYPDLTTVVGVPVIQRANTSNTHIEKLLIALCWKTAFHCKRREGFPSWTWAGWYGANPFLENDEADIVNTYNVSVELVSEQGKATDFGSLIRRSSQAAVRKDDSRARLSIECPVIQAKFVRCTRRGKDSVQPQGRAEYQFFCGDGYVSVDCRSFPPTSTDSTLDLACQGEVYTVLLLGPRADTRGVVNAGMVVMLAVKRSPNGCYERVWLLECEEDELQLGQHNRLVDLRRRILLA